jgi:hypothetical protein
MQINKPAEEKTKNEIEEAVLLIGATHSKLNIFM